MQPDEPSSEQPAASFDPVALIRAVRFEYQMAVATAIRAHQLLHPSDDDEFIAGVAFVESFLVHARCLDEFLASRGNYRTDARASDFVAEFSDPPLEPGVRDSINRALQHITLYRQDGHLPWVPLELLVPIVEAMDHFIKDLALNNPELADQLTEVHANAEVALSRSSER